MSKRPITAETLRHVRERREKERDKLAAEYELAASMLDELWPREFRNAASHLRHEAERWRR